MIDPTEHAYLEKVLRFASQHRFTEGTVTHIEVAHDNDCEFVRGIGPCNCKPVLDLVPDEDEV
jgi:hypothetical protein